MKLYRTISLLMLVLTISSFAQELPYKIIDNNPQSRNKQMRLLSNEINPNQEIAIIPTIIRPYNVLNYDLFIDLRNVFNSKELDSLGRIFKGTNHIKLIIDSNNVTQLEFDSYNLYYETILLKPNNISLNYKISDYYLIIDLPQELSIKKGDTIDIEINYTYATNYNYGFYAYPKDYYVGLGPVYINENGETKRDAVYVEERLAYTQSEIDMTRCWMPCNDIPSDKAVASMAIQVPKEYTVASNGLLNKIEVLNDSKIFYWSDTTQISPYLMMFASSKYKEFSDWYIPDSNPNDSIEIKYYIWESDYTDTDTMRTKYDALKSFKNVPAMMKLYSDTFIDYPYSKYGMVSVQPYGFGGMEHQTMTTINRNWLYGWSEIGIAHELVHQWLGDLITCKTWNDLWINEGGATWGESFWYEYTWNSPAGRYYHLQNTRDAYLERTSLYNTPIYGIPTNGVFDWGSVLTYQKAGWVYNMLREMLGDDKFFTTLRQLLKHYSFKALDTEEFKNFFKDKNQNPPVDFDTFFEQWIYRAGHPTYKFNVTANKINDNKTDISLFIEQTQDYITNDNIPEVFSMPLRFNFFDENGDIYTLTVINNQRTQNYKFSIPFKPISIELDTNAVLCQVESTNFSDIKNDESLVFSNSFVFPNPIIQSNTAKIQINSNEYSIFKIDLYDILGNKINTLYNSFLSIGVNHIPFNTKDLSTGIYTIRIERNNHIESIKFSIVK